MSPSLLSRSTRTRRATLAVVAFALLAAACTGGDDLAVQEDPRAALVAAMDTTAAFDGYEFTFAVQLDRTARDAADEALRADPEAELTPDGLELLLDSSLRVRSIPGEGRDGSENRTALTVTIGRRDVFEVIALPAFETYVRVDAPGIIDLVTTVGGIPQDEIQGELAVGEAEFAAQGLGELWDAGRRGRWIALTGIEPLARLYSGMLAGAGFRADEARLAALQDDIWAEVDQLLAEADVTYLGSEPAGARVRVTVTGAQLVRSAEAILAPMIEASFGEFFAAEFTNELSRELAKVPANVRLSVDAWIQRGRVSQIGFDVFGFARGLGEQDVPDGELSLLLGIDEFTGQIDAPRDAYELNLFRLMGGLMGSGFEDLFG